MWGTPVAGGQGLLFRHKLVWFHLHTYSLSLAVCLVIPPSQTTWWKVSYQTVLNVCHLFSNFERRGPLFPDLRFLGRNRLIQSEHVFVPRLISCGQGTLLHVQAWPPLQRLWIVPRSGLAQQSVGRLRPNISKDKQSIGKAKAQSGLVWWKMLTVINHTRLWRWREEATPWETLNCQQMSKRK